MRFTPIRDPATGRIDMVENIQVEWGVYGRSAAVAQALGTERYDAFYPENFEGVLQGTRDLHDATLVEIISLMAPHVREDGLDALARIWIDAAELVRKRIIPMATMMFGLSIDGIRSIIILNVTQHETILVLFDEKGAILTKPLAYWNENGAFSTGIVDTDNVDEQMVDLQFQMRRADNTRLAVAAKRTADEQPEGVISMAAYRAMKAVRV